MEESAKDVETQAVRTKPAEEGKTRLAIVAYHARAAGVGNALCALVARLDYARFDVTVLFSTDEDYEGSSILDRLDPRARVIVADRTRCVTFRRRHRWNLLRRVGGFLWRRLPRPLRPLGRALYDVEARLYARYIRRELGPAAVCDVVVAYDTKAAEEAVRAFSCRRFLLVYHCGEKECVYHQELGLAAADCILSVGRHVADDIRRWWPEYAEKVAVAENLVDVQHVLARAEEPLDGTDAAAFEPGFVHVVTCARLSPLKGIDLGLKAVALLAHEGAPAFRWHVIGWDWEESVYREQARRLGIEGLVVFHGHRPNPYPLMRRADVYLQPSLKEALGLTISEALLLGCPVVSTRTAGGIDQLSEPGVKGVLCDVSAEGIAAALRPLLADPAAREALRNRDDQARCEELNRRRITRFESLCIPENANDVS